MDFYEEASLVMVPSGYKDQKVYSSVPDDGSGDLTFSRASSATRVASNGYIEKAKVNLLLQSNTFLTASWDVSSVTLTSGQSGYDGSSDAWKLESNVTNANIFQIISTSGVSTFSVYAKAGNASWIRLRYDNTSTADVNLWCNLTDGSLGVDSGVSSYTENIGGGWYRIVVQANTNDLNNLRIYPATSDGGNSSTGEYIYIQDAQLNYGLVAQEYQETTTTSVVSGITNDMPRLDYSGGASCPSLLLEPSRTNAITMSEYFDGGNLLNTSISADYNTADTLSPEGVYNAAKLTATASFPRYYDFPTIGDNVNIVVSIFAKAGDASQITIRGNNKNNETACVVFDLSTGGAGFAVDDQLEPTFDIEPYSNDWYRCWISFSTGSGGTAFGYRVINHGYDYGANGWWGTKYVYAYGAQFEAGAYPTSYIPTYGTSATRTGESCSKTGISSLIGQTEGTIFVDFIYDAANTANERLTISDGTSAKRIFMIINTSKLLTFTCTNAGSDQWNINTSLTVGQRYKIAGAYKANDIVFYVNGVQIGTDTSASIPDCSNLYFANENGSTQEWNNLTNQLLLFPTRLSNADLATLTTL